MLDQVPSVAAFHLKRFKNDGSYVEKIDKHVQVPLELDLLPYTNSSQNDNVDLKYYLYAIVVHIGFSSTSGHYYCFVRSAPDIWHRLDDSKVTRVQEDFVLSQEAYILFYAKQGTPWFSTFMETQKLFFDHNMSNTSPKSVLDNVDHNGTLSPSVPSVVNSHRLEIHETKDAADGIPMESSIGLRHERVEVNEAVDDSHRIYTPVPVAESNSCEGTSCKVGKMCTPSPLGEKNCNLQSVKIKNNANITPQTPPRSPSPDIYAEELPEVIITRSHLLRSQDKVPSKRTLNKDLENPERKQARKILRTMPNVRSSQLMAALEGSDSEGLNKKRNRKMGLSSKKDDSPSSARHRSNLSSVMRTVAAGNLR
ncbi:hypothetical protein F0562_007731 [Nyssa sinensis]|uniref:USP domain-containing protein n=1 Tax=Nyssa sinensis TaxID=561372 RepID=A0A5J5A7T3_9ASTE|nr:hypothetical protein F0562_007731 [Nyssa sinensis]